MFAVLVGVVQNRITQSPVIVFVVVPRPRFFSITMDDNDFIWIPSNCKVSTMPTSADFERIRLVSGQRSFAKFFSYVMVLIMFPARYSANQFSIPTAILSLSVFLISWCNAESSLNFITPTNSPWDADEGHLTLAWEHSGGSRGALQSVFQLEQGDEMNFTSAKIAYQGTDNSTFISGLAGGTYFFRVRSLRESVGPGPWSEIMQVNVSYVSPKLVAILFFVGVTVLITTVGAILKGHNRYKSD